MKHYPTCSPNYPEKVGKPQSVTDIDAGDGTFIRSCDDCGAFEIVQRCSTVINGERCCLAEDHKQREHSIL